MAEEEFDFADIESVVALRNLLQKREDDGEASDAQALNEQIDVAWDGLNNFSNKLTYISTSQDVTHAWPSQQLKVLEADRSCTCSLELLQKETLIVQPCRQRLRYWKLTCILFPRYTSMPHFQHQKHCRHLSLN